MWIELSISKSTHKGFDKNIHVYIHYTYVWAYLPSCLLDYVEAKFSFNFNFHNELTCILLRKLNNLAATIFYSKTDFIPNKMPRLLTVPLCVHIIFHAKYQMLMRYSDISWPYCVTFDTLWLQNSRQHPLHPGLPRSCCVKACGVALSTSET